MKHFFHKSSILIIFSSAISFVLTFGMSLLMKIQASQNSDLNDNFLIIGVIILVVVLLLLNVTDVLSFWLRGKKKEIYVKNIIGMNNNQIYIPLYINLNLLVLLSSMIGIILSIVFAHLIRPVIAIEVHMEACLLSFVFCILIENSVNILIIKYKLRHGFLEWK